MKDFALKTIPVCIFGILAGLLNGLLGAGGGILIVLALRRFCHANKCNPRAAFTGALAVMVPITAFSAWRYAHLGHIPTTDLPAILLPALLGGIVGAGLLPHLSMRFLSRLFAAAVLVSGVLLVV